jgi:solute carrier family 35 protein E3
VLGIDYVWYGRKASPRVTASVMVVCLGVGLATITDPQLSSNLAGLAAGFGSVAATALYQIWAGSKQKELGMGSMQLLHQYVPLAAALLGVLVPIFEPVGWVERGKDTILGFEFDVGSVTAIAISSVLGLAVNLTTFLVIGATSSLTYNVVGHIKTVLILSGGVMFFGDTMPPKKMAGIMAAMGGIIWCGGKGGQAGQAGRAHREGACKRQAGRPPGGTQAPFWQRQRPPLPPHPPPSPPAGTARLS